MLYGIHQDICQNSITFDLVEISISDLRVKKSQNINMLCVFLIYYIFCCIFSCYLINFFYCFLKLFICRLLISSSAIATTICISNAWAAAASYI